MTRISLGFILLVAVLLRVTAMIVNLEFFTLPQGGGDAAWLEYMAWEHAWRGREELSYYLQSNSKFIVLPASYIYSVTGREPYILGLLMVALGVGVVALSYRAALELWEDVGVARIVALAVALFPQLILHSALFLREMPVTFCLTAATLCAIRYVKHNNIVQVGWFAAWVAVGALFHSGVIVAIPALLLGVLFARPHRKKSSVRFYLVNGAAALLFVAVIFGVNETGFGLGKFGGSLYGALDEFGAREMRGTEGGAAFPEWMRIRGGMSEAWKLPVRYVALLFSPLVPFLVRSPNHLLGVFDAALYLGLFWTIFRRWNLISQSRPAIVVLVIMLTLFLIYALGVSNFGTAIRHRAKIASILLILAAGLPALARRRRRMMLSAAIRPQVSA